MIRDYCTFSFVDRLLIDDITIISCEKNIVKLSYLRFYLFFSSCFLHVSIFFQFFSFYLCVYSLEWLFFFLSFFSFFGVKSTVGVACLDCAMICDFPLISRRNKACIINPCGLCIFYPFDFGAWTWNHNW